MIVYIITYFCILLLIVLYHSKQFFKSSMLLYFAGAILIFVAGLRFLVGTDYIHYANSYHIYLSRSFDSFSFLAQPGLTITARIASLIYDDYASWFFLMSVITIVPVVYSVKNYSISPAFSILLFVVLGCWHFSFNLVKQTAAASIILLGYPAIRDKNFKKWVIVCLLGALFHFSAILMIPVYFLAAGRTSKKTIGTTIAFGLFIFFFYDRLFDVASFLKRGENLVSIHSGTRNDSVNILRVLVNLIPLLLFVLFRREYRFDDSDLEAMFNMSLLNGALNIGTMNSIYIYRFCVYTNIFNILFIPMMLSKLKSSNRRIITVLLTVFYTAFWLYDLNKGSTTAVFHWIFER